MKDRTRISTENVLQSTSETIIKRLVALNLDPCFTHIIFPDKPPTSRELELLVAGGKSALHIIPGGSLKTLTWTCNLLRTR
jgi:hypothetical protein